MATWTALTFPFGSLLTSTQMTQMQANLTAITEGAAGAPNIVQAALTTATASDSVVINSGADDSIALSGGTWSWWTASAANEMMFGDGDTAAGTIGFTNNGGGSETVYIDERYITASPPYKIGDVTWGHFLYLLRNKSTGKILGACEAENPTWAYHGKLWLKKNEKDRIAAAPHPFASYWKKKDLTSDGLEVVLMDLRNFDIKQAKHDVLRAGKRLNTELVKVVKPGKVVKYSDFNLPAISGFTDRVTIRARG